MRVSIPGRVNRRVKSRMYNGSPKTSVPSWVGKLGAHVVSDCFRRLRKLTRVWRMVERSKVGLGTLPIDENLDCHVCRELLGTGSASNLGVNSDLWCTVRVSL